jgi:chromosome partitioning protein
MVGQKGGVGKSSIARLLAVVAAKGLSVKIADLDTLQTTSVNWAARRAENRILPEVRVEAFKYVRTALKDSESFDLYIFDGAPHSSRETKQACVASDMVIIPTSESIDDLHPSVILANNLMKEGVPSQNIAFLLCITSDSEREVEGAREYLRQTPYKILDGNIPFRAAYKAAMDQGKALTETPFKTLKEKADQIAQSIIDAIADSVKRRSATNGKLRKTKN